jgi:crotonobetainyl-CoA:carnitine CoA-transferase CaiB-like acyl-CoA transferase
MQSALAGLRVVDMSHYLAGPTVAMQFADLGADVIRIDPPAGPSWNHPANAVLQRGKRSIALDLNRPEDVEIARQLIDAADVVIESWRPGVADRLGVGPQQSLSRNRKLIYCSIPGFAHDDPRAGIPGWEGVIAAAAGLYPKRESGDLDAPRFSALPMASSFASMQACHAIMAALIGRDRSGLGQHVEVALFDAAFELLGGGAQKVGNVSPAPQGGPAPATAPQIGHYRCSDGRWVQLCLIQPRHLGWFVGAFLPERVADGWADPARINADSDIQAEMRSELTALMSTKTAVEWERLINESSQAPTGVCQTTEDWLRRDEHARDSHAVVEVDGDPEFGLTIQAGHPLGLSATPPRPTGPRHALDADRTEILAELAALPPRRDAVPTTDGDAVLPLHGVKVVDVSQVLAGPTSARILADYGAQVVKVNSPLDRQHFQHVYTNSGKQSILLDLKKQAGMDLLWRLVDDADVFVENFTRGVADRMGIGEAVMRERRPQIIYTSVSAFGHEGYRGGYRGREELGQALTGIQMRWFGEDEPRMVFYALNDYGAGNWAAFATLVALYHATHGGSGQKANSSLSHAGTFHQLPFMLAYDGQVRNEPSGIDALGWSPWDRLYQASDRWIYLAAHGSGNRDTVATIMKAAIAPDADDDATAALLERTFKSRAADEWVAALTAEGIGAAVVLDQEQAMDGASARTRGVSLTRTQPDGEPIRTVGPARRLLRTPLRPHPVPGPPGSNARRIVADAGLSDHWDDLVATGAVVPELPADAEFVGRFRTPPRPGS